MRQWFTTAANSVGNAAHQKLDEPNYRDGEAHRYPEVVGEMLRRPLERIPQRRDSLEVPTPVHIHRRRNDAYSISPVAENQLLPARPEDTQPEPTFKDLTRDASASYPNVKDQLPISRVRKWITKLDNDLRPGRGQWIAEFNEQLQPRPGQRFEISDDEDQEARRYPEVPGEMLRMADLERIDIQYTQLREQNSRAESTYATSITSASSLGVRGERLQHLDLVRTDRLDNELRQTRFEPQSQMDVIENASIIAEPSMTIDPWDVEYTPNPVIFAHLADCVNVARDDEASSSSVHQLSTSLDPESISQQYMSNSLKRKNSHSSEVLEYERCLGHDEGPTITPPRNKRRAHNQQLTQKPDCLMAGLVSSGSQPSQFHTLDRPILLHTTRSSLAHAQLALEQNMSDQSYRTTPTSTSSEEQATPESSAPSEGNQSLVCTECDIEFRTTGQRREHQNRKHIRHFKCDMCDRAFNLQADLGRHERTVHKVDNATMVRDQEECVSRCPNKGCKTANKVWDRKDNLARHVVRCQKALTRSSEKHNRTIEAVVT
jgi:hypothetical protein